jgi:hypothetical protein
MMAFAVFMLPLAAQADGKLWIGPIPGLTSTWHLAPERVSIPIGSGVLRFQSRVPEGASVVWRGATEGARRGEWTSAVCHVTEVGRHVVTVQYVRPDGTKLADRCVFDAVRIRPEQIEFSPVQASVYPVDLDEDDLNASSIATSRPDRSPACGNTSKS